MNELVVPPAPLWYKNSVVACSPDNTLVYGSKNDVIVVREKGPEEPAEIKIIQAAHSKNVTSVSLNKKFGNPHSYAVSLGEDSTIKVWDLEIFEKKFSNNDHTEHKESVIGAVFAGDDRIVSAAANGFIVVWNINTNESRPLKDLFNFKVTLTCLSSCPHAGWLLAFGLNNGGVIVADLRRNGQILYKLRGHHQAVVSLSWCPAPVNVFPRYTQNKVKNRSPEIKEEEKQDEETQKEIKKPKQPNPWVNLVHADDDEVPPEPGHSFTESVDDFLKECDNLKSKIMGLELPKEVNDENEEDLKEIQECEEKGIEETKTRETASEQVLNNERPLPKLFDPSGDFLDDSVLDQTDPTEEEILEDKDVGDEKNSDNDHNEKSQDGGDNTIDVTSPIGEDSGIVGDAPVQEVAEEEPRTEYLLASSGKDRSIYIWRAGTDGRMQTFFHVPKKSRSRDAKNANYWITICWIAPDTLLTSSTMGELLAWSLPKPKDYSKLYKVIHFEHSSQIFNIVTPPKYFTEYNWREKIDLSVWTWSQDGRLISYDLRADKIRLCYSAVTASVTCFDASSLDPNRLAIGVRDGSIRVWDLSLPHAKIIAMHKYQQKITLKVSAIAWHPLKEMILGFGTDEGRVNMNELSQVGFIEMVSKKSTLFPHFFRNQVYKVEWGPIKGDTANLGLYVVAEGKILIYDIKNPTGDPILLELPEKLYIYKFAWKPDFKLLLLNTKDGSLVALTSNLVAITTIYLHEKGLNEIVWHPDAFTIKTEISPRCNWFAATTTNGILVYDCALLKENASLNENVMEKIVVVLEGHLRPPLSLAWCPFDGNKLVSTAADGLAHVWDLTSKAVIATFVDPLLSHNPAVIWSPIDPDLIIVGDKLIRIWSISKNPPKVDEEFMAARKRLLSKATKSEPEKADKNKIKVDIPQIKKKSKNCIVPSFYVSNDENLSLQVANMRKLMNNDIMSTSESENNRLDPLQLFGAKDQVSQLLNANYNQQKREGKHKSCELISLWRGNVGDEVKAAINENRVTPSIIAIAPMVSPKLWQEACEVYATKLMEDADSDPLETAMYFLACHKIEEAINCLCLNSLFREALALAKHRLPDKSEIIDKITEKWAEHCVVTGNFENAAFCYISVGQYINAAKVLARRNTKEFLDFAAELAEKEGNKELYDSIKFKCNEIQTEKSEVKSELPSRADAVLKGIAENDEVNSETDSELQEVEEKPQSVDKTEEQNEFFSLSPVPSVSELAQTNDNLENEAKNDTEKKVEEENMEKFFN